MHAKMLTEVRVIGMRVKPAISPLLVCFLIGIAISIGIGIMFCAAARPAVAQSTASASAQRQTAVALEQQGKFVEAEAAWRALTRLQPENSEAYAHLGFLEAHQEHYKAAVPLYRKALALNPSMPGLQMNLGLALFKADELRAAIQIFTPLLKRQPPASPDAQRLTTLLGLAYYGLHEYPAAIPYLKAATAADSQSLPYRFFLAHSCLAAKQYQCVLDVYHEILTLNAESAEADMLAGEALDEMQDHVGALAQFRAAVKANPQEPNVHFGLGYLLWTQNQYDDAAPEFQAELANVPTHAQAMTYLADTYMKLNNPQAARPLLENAIRLDPRMALAHVDLGTLDADADRKEDALREFKLAASLTPDDVSVHWHLARLYQSMGRKEDAKIEFQKTSSLTKAADDSVFSKINAAKNKTQESSEPPTGQEDQEEKPKDAK